MMTVITTLVIIFQVSIIQFVKSRFIDVNITNLQQIVSVFEWFTFECFPDCDIKDFLRLIAFLNILDGVETILLNISESRKQDGTAVYIYPTIVKIDSVAVFLTCIG